MKTAMQIAVESYKNDGVSFTDWFLDNYEMLLEKEKEQIIEAYNQNITGFDKLEQEGALEEFMLGLEPLIKPEDIPFEPHCYITSRRIKNEITEKWIDQNGFPTRPVYSVPANSSKIEVAKASGIDIFVDDRYENFVELNNAGICTYLFDAPHNQRYDVGHKRIYSLKELI